MHKTILQKVSNCHPLRAT